MLKKIRILRMLFLFLIALTFLCAAAPEVSAAPYQLTRTLRIGMRGEDVSVVQQLLKDQGFLHTIRLQDILEP